MLGVRFLPRKSGRNPSIEIIIRGSDELSIINYKNIVNIIKLIASRLPQMTSLKVDKRHHVP